MLFFLSWLLFLSVSGPQAASNFGSKVVRRVTIDGHPNESTIYTMDHRQRTEWRTSVARPNADGSLEVEYRPPMISIFRCDLGESFSVFPLGKTYTVATYRPDEEFEESERAREKPRYPEPAKPTVRIESTTVDTGEREEILGRIARHVITRTKQIPLEGSHAETKELVSDGWFIDLLDRTIPCKRKLREGNVYAGYIYTRTGGLETSEKPEVIDFGIRETGLALRSSLTITTTTVLPDGSEKHSETRNGTEVTLLEVGPLDPTVFEVPPGFTRVKFMPSPDIGRIP
jgi:hypothetical protein